MDEWLAGSVIDQLDQWVMGERKRAFSSSVRLSFPLFLELRREIIQVWISTALCVIQWSSLIYTFKNWSEKTTNLEKKITKRWQNEAVWHFQVHTSVCKSRDLKWANS